MYEFNSFKYVNDFDATAMVCPEPHHFKAPMEILSTASDTWRGK